jgi:hypothetical protein
MATALARQPLCLKFPALLAGTAKGARGLRDAGGALSDARADASALLGA